MADVEPAGDVLDSRRAGGLIIRGGTVRLLGYVTMSGLSVLSFALVARHLGVARFGDYTTALSIITVVQAVTDAGMTTLALREYTTSEGDARARMMRNLLGARLALTVAGVLVAFGIGVGLGFDEALLIGTLLAGIGVGLNVLQAMVAVPLAAQLRLTTTTLIELGRHVLLVAALVVLVAIGAGVLPLLAATIPAAVAGFVATVVLVRGDVSLRPALERDEVARLLRLTLPVALATATGTFYVYMAQVLTDTVATEVESGLFAAAFRVFIVLGAIPGIVVSAAFPLLSRAARDDETRLAYAVDRLFATTLVGGALVSLLVCVGAQPAIDVVAGADYDGAVPALRIQAWALLASFLIATAGLALLSLHHHRDLLIANAIALAVSAVLTIQLAADDGATGAATASLIGESVLAVALLAYLARIPGLAPGFGVVPKVVVATAAGALVTLLPLAAVPETILAGVVFSAVALAARAVPDELLEVVRR